VFPCVARGLKARASFMFAGGSRWRSLAVDGSSGASRGHAPVVRRPGGRRLCPAAPVICPVTARTLQGMAPYPGQARCLALGFWPEWPRRLRVKVCREKSLCQMVCPGGYKVFSVWAGLDAEGGHVTIQGPSPDLSPATTLAPFRLLSSMRRLRPPAPSYLFRPAPKVASRSSALGGDALSGQSSRPITWAASRGQCRREAGSRD
jgi:hypothetical protein